MAVKNSLTNSGAKNIKFQTVIKAQAVQENIMSTLGSASKTKTFTAALISAVSTNKDLQACDGVSVISAALLGESLNLSPSPQLGHYYMVPFGDHGSTVKKATFQLGYKGYIQLAIRSGQYKKLNVVAVKDGELKSFNPFTEDIDVSPIEDPDAREKAKTIGYYAMFELVNGFKKCMYWSKAKMEAHAEKYSMGYKAHKGYTFWEKDFDGMAFKTMLRQLISKWGIMSIEMQNAFASDNTYKETLDPEEAPKYEDNDDAIDVDVNEDTGEAKEESKQNNNDSLLGDLA
jgi:recombination protein RecT